jgi:hypothetical protein
MVFFKRFSLSILVIAAFHHSFAADAKPKVWIYTDMSDSALKGPTHMGTVNDPDDISAMASYLLMANEFETLGIVVASTHRKEHRDTPDQGAWANRFFGDAYRAEVAALNRAIGGYPADIRFVQSSIKESGERFDPATNYADLGKFPTVKALLDVVDREPAGATINVLCWGTVTEPAILVSHCLATGRADVLKKLRFIAHWTDSSLHQGTPVHPEHVANCREDAAACAYMKMQARDGVLRYYECGAIGQHGIVSGGPKGAEYFSAFKRSRLGKIFTEGKFVQNGVDHSDSASYWVLLGKWGVGLDDLADDGNNPPSVERANEQKFREHSKRIHDELLRRAKAAAETR